MGMLSRAQKPTKEKKSKKAQNELVATPIVTEVTLYDELAKTLTEISNLRGISVEQLVNIRMASYCRSYQRCKILRLNDHMPYGQYEGTLIEDMIRTDPRYTNYLASNSDTFVLDEEATNLLKELS